MKLECLNCIGLVQLLAKIYTIKRLPKLPKVEPDLFDEKQLKPDKKGNSYLVHLVQLLVI